MEHTWSGYESHLHLAIQQLIDGTVDAETWARTLVPFVTGLLVRGPDFNERFEQRAIIQAARPFLDAPDHNTNMARAFEMQRLLGPIMVGEWCVATVPGNEKLITNDIAFVPFGLVGSNKTGIAIPLDHKHLLGVFVRTRGPVAFAKEQRWYPCIHYLELDKTDIPGLNTAVAVWAKRFVFGSDRKCIEQYVPPTHNPLSTPEPGALGFIFGKLGAIHQYTWHRFVSVLNKPINSEDAFTFPICWAEVEHKERWSPVVLVPLGRPPFCAPSFSRKGNMINIDLCDIPDWPIKIQPYVERRVLPESVNGI